MNKQHHVAYAILNRPGVMTEERLAILRERMEGGEGRMVLLSEVIPEIDRLKAELRTKNDIMERAGAFILGLGYYGDAADLSEEAGKAKRAEIDALRAEAKSALEYGARCEDRAEKAEAELDGLLSLNEESDTSIYLRRAEKAEAELAAREKELQEARQSVPISVAL